MKRPSKALCRNCRHLSALCKNTRVNYWCEHPNQRYIHDYFMEHGIHKHPSYIGSRKIGEENFCVQNTPKWCPKFNGGNVDED